MNSEDLVLLKQALDKINALETENARLKAGAQGDIAVIGIGCRFPGGVNTPDAYWELLTAGRKAYGPIPEKRKAWFRTWEPDFEQKITAGAGGYLEDIDQFDPLFFGISPKEAKVMDPQQRMLLEVAWETFEHAGYPGHRLKGSSTGVFTGITLTDYKRYLEGQDDLGTFGVTGVSHNAIAGRLAYLLGLQGPAIAVDTACSSSLVALDMAIRHLRSGSCEYALAGGVNLILTPDSMLVTSGANMISPEGQCFTFDAAANGIARGEGCGLVLLKPLARAQEDGDTIYATILGTAVNNNGAGSGLTVPNGRVQESLIRAALGDAETKANEIDFIEAHGTATPLGDPIEVNALNGVFGKHRPADQPLLIGSVKANFGHLEAAAGIAGLIKVVLSLYHRTLPPHVHFQKPSPHIDWDKMPISVVTQAAPLNTHSKAGLSSFGATGTNAHLILEAADAVSPASRSQPEQQQLLMISAKTAAALPDLARKYAAAISPATDLQALCVSARNSREQFQYRIAVSTKDATDLRAQLLAFAAGKPAPAVAHTASGSTPIRDLVWLFTGQGAQFTGMGRDLYESLPVFRTAFDRCADAARTCLDIPLPALLFAAEHAGSLQQTKYAQPALFALEYAMASSLMAWGIRPKAVAGHSLGEYVAACIAGIWDLETAMQLVCKRGELMQAMPYGGKMAAIMAPVDEVRPLLEHSSKVNIAAINGPAYTVVSGAASDLDQVVALATEKGMHCLPLKVSHAFHSEMMDAALPEFQDFLEKLTYNSAAIPLVSTLHCRPLKAEEYSTPQYWVKHLRDTVDFKGAVEHLHAAGSQDFLEIGPKPVLRRMVRESLATTTARVFPFMQKGIAETDAFYRCLGTLFVHGQALNWDHLDQASNTPRMALPFYPFQRKSYWIAPAPRILPISSSQVSSENTGMDNGNLQTPAASQEFNLSEYLVRLVAGITEMHPDEVPLDTNLFSMGMDSIMIIRLKQDLAQDFGVEISVSDFYAHCDTLQKIIAYLEEHKLHLPAGATIAPVSTPIANAPTATKIASTQGNSLVEDIIRGQMEIMQQQLALLQGNPIPTTAPGAARSAPKPDAKSFVPFRKIEGDKTAGQAVALSPNLQDMITAVNSQTATSKRLTQENRVYLANNRAVAGFRPQWKEMIYQLIVERAQGSKIWDTAGKEFIDFTMGFGVNLFGHNPDFIRKAVAVAMEKGPAVGPMSHLAGPVARMLCQLTGMERAAFYNTGTEAIMVALRLARTATGRNKVVIFAGSYHGTFDGILAKRGTGDSGHLSIPIAPGIPPGMIEDIYVLPYADPESLKFIEREAPSLAAVLVETVQSRKPDLQPQEFLLALRNITEQHGAALIFDEVITGFRIHAKGAQKHFGIAADIATYGKVIGGGMPIGIVAGKSKFLDGVDGGTWEYGDGSYPKEKTTFVAGTFCHHPLALAASQAVMQKLIDAGPALHETLNQRTSAMCQQLNAWYQREGFALEMVHFGSLFRFVLRGNYELLFFKLLEKGFYIWEGRNCFLSTAHSDEEVTQFIEAVQASLIELRDKELIPASKKQATTTPTISKGTEQTHYPASYGQQSVWMAEQMDLGSSAYHLGAALEFRGELQPQILERALQALMGRHAALRTTFEEVDDQILQKVHDQVELKLQYETANLSSPDAGLIAGFLQRAFHQTFDLSKGPLVRANLLTLGDSRHLLALTMHHIVTDGWSMNILFKELLAFYEAFRSETVPAFPPLHIQYPDFAAWQLQYLSSEKGRAARKFWHDNLPTTTPRLSRDPDDSQETEGQLLSKFPAELTHKLKATAQQHGVSLFTVLESLLAVLLVEQVDGNRIFLGTPAAGRTQSGLDKQVGYYLNLIILQAEIQQNESFAALAQRLHRQDLAAFDHQDYPFDLLVRELKPDRVGNQSPFFDVELTLDSFDKNAGEVQLADGALTVNAYEEGAAMDPRKFLLEFKFMEKPDGLHLAINYDRQQLSEARMERLQQACQEGISAITEQPDLQVATLRNLGSPAKKSEIGVSGPEVDFPHQDIVSLMEEAMATHAAATAIKIADTEWSYQQLRSKVDAIAGALQGTGVGQGDLVAICQRRSPELIASILAILQTGAAYLPLDAAYPLPRITEILEDAAAKFLIADAEQALRLGEVGTKILPVSQLINANAIFTPQAIAPDLIAYMMYTSGSSGKPKGCLISQQSLSNYIQWANSFYFDEATTGNFPFYTSISFDLTLTSIFSTLSRGKCLTILPESLSTDEILSRIFTDPTIDTVKITPAHLRYLAELDVETTGLKVAIVGGEALEIPQRDLLFELNPQMAVFNEYGPTEATVGCIVQRLSPEETEILIGHPVANSEVFLLDDAGKAVAPGELGTLHIAGAGLAEGYWNRTALTAKRFVGHLTKKGHKMYCTGDLAVQVAGGAFAYRGRNDAQIKVQGHRIEPEEITMQAMAFSGVGQALVQASPDGLHLFCTGEVDPTALKSYLKAHLPTYMVPEQVIKIDAIPLTINGKVDYAALPIPQVEADSPAENAGDKVENSLLQLYAKALGHPEMGLDDDFFALGGHSLTGIRLISRIHKNFDQRLKYKEFLAQPTVRQMAKYLTRKQKTIFQEIPQAATSTFYPLSRAQQRIWLLHQQDPTAATFNMPGAFFIRGTCDFNLLERAFQAVIDRHSALRTIFPLVDAQPMQQVLPELPFSLSFTQAPENGKRAAFIQRSIQRHAELQFDLENGPLLQVEIIELPDQTICLYNIHHIVSDGWSETVFVNDLLHFYRHFSGAATAELTPLRIQYPDYSIWHNQLLDAPEMEMHARYWQERFTTPVEALELPTDLAGKQENWDVGQAFVRNLDAELTQQLKDLSSAQQATLFSVLLAAVKVLLFRYSGQEDIVVGTPEAGRDHLDLEGQIGFFVNMLPLRDHIASQHSFKQVLESVNATLHAAHAHKSYPFDALMEWLRTQQPEHQPLFNVDVGMLQDNLRKLREDEVLEFEVIPPSRTICKFDLTINFIERDSQIRVEIDYRTALFSEARIETIFSNFEQLLRGALAQPEQNIMQYSLLTEQEVNHLKKFEKGEKKPEFQEQSWRDLWENSVQQFSERQAVRHDGVSLSYAELDQASDRLASGLLKLPGFAPGQAIGVLAVPSPELLIALLGIYKSGGIYLPLEPSNPEKRLSFMLEDAGATHVLYGARTKANFKSIPQISIAELAASDLADKPEFPTHPANSPAYLIYTSGSTGLPKGVLVNHDSFVNMTRAQIEAFGVKAGDRCLLFASPAFDASLSEVFMALYAGATLVPIPMSVKGMAAPFLEFMDREAITVATIPPAFLALLDRDPLPGLRVIISAGEPVAPELARYYAADHAFFNAYGPTEFSVCASIFPVPARASAYHAVPIGRPIPNAEIRILNESLVRVPAGMIGEIFLAGAGLADRYLGQAELTAAAFLDDPENPGQRIYRSGDLGKWTAEGELIFMGRRDSQVKVRGYRIETGELEALLQQHPAVESCVVQALPLDNGNELVAWVVGSTLVDAAEFHEFLGQSVPAYMIPTHWVALEALPFTASGKIDRKALPHPAKAAQVKAETGSVPHSGVQLGVKKIWEELLTHRPIGLEDNFFAIGGHSLVATRMATAIFRDFEVQLRLNQILTNPTVAGIAHLIENTEVVVEKEGIPRLATQDQYPASSAQKQIAAAQALSLAPEIYNIPIAFYITGPLNIAAFEKALNNLVARHESLRTTIEILPEGAIQKVHEGPASFSFHDLRGKDNQQEQVEKFILDEAKTPFELQYELPIRLQLVQIEEEKHLLLLTLHHIVGDGWSMEIVLRELVYFYRRANDGVGYPMEDLKIQYRDYTAWNEKRISGSFGKSAREFWKKQFADLRATPQFPADFAKAKDAPHAQEILRHSFPAASVYLIEDLSQAENVSQFMVMLAVLNVVLHSYSGHETLILGSPVSGRGHADLEGQVGMYMNMIPLKNEIQAEDRFLDLLKRVKTNTLAAFEFQSWPFENLLQALDWDREPGRNPIFDIEIDFDLFQPENILSGNNLPPDWKLTSHYEDGGLLSRKYELEFRLRRADDLLNLTLVYDPQRYRQETMRNLVAGLEVVMDQVGLDPLVSLKTLLELLKVKLQAQKEVTKQAEKQRKLGKFLKTKVAKPSNALNDSGK